MTRFLILKLTSISHIALIAVLIVLNGCNSTNLYNDIDENRTIIKIGAISYNKSEFEDVCNSIQNSGVSKDSAIKRTLKASILNSVILNYLDSIHFGLTKEDENELDNLNRSALIKMAQDSLLKYITINPKNVRREIERFKEKQIVVDFVWLPVKDNKIIKECFSFLNSGGSTADMIYSDKWFFERITELGGQIRRLNVEPGQFPSKISKFITSGKKDETRVIHVGKGYYVMKILYTKKDNFQHWDCDDVERNYKISSYLNYSPLYSNFKISDINLEILNNADFSVEALDGNNKYAAEFKGSKITLKEIKDQINLLPFNQKIFFNNISCVPSSVATLILLNGNKRPVISEDIITDLSNKGYLDALNEDNRNYERYYNYFEYQWLQSFEKLTIYPWLFPFLFEDFSEVRLNYDLLYKNQLVDFKEFDLKDKIAVSSNSGYLTAEDFIKELDAIDKVSAARLMNIDNSRKLIYYYFEENNVNFKPQSSIKIDNTLLENVLINYIQNLEFENFTSDIFGVMDRNPRKYFSGETQIYNSPELSININELRTLVSKYPNTIQLNIQTDQTAFNKYWRLNALIYIIENEIWVRKAKKLNLQNSDNYRLQVEKNTNKLRIRSFLNSGIEEINDNLFFTKIKNSKMIDIWIDSKYFDGHDKYINSLKNNLVNHKYQELL